MDGFGVFFIEEKDLDFEEVVLVDDEHLVGLEEFVLVDGEVVARKMELGGVDTRIWRFGAGLVLAGWPRLPARSRRR